MISLCMVQEGLIGRVVLQGNWTSADDRTNLLRDVSIATSTTTMRVYTVRQRWDFTNLYRVRKQPFQPQTKMYANRYLA